MHEFTLPYTQLLDKQDKLKAYRDKFYIPYLHDKHAQYFLGNSLGLQPITTQNEVLCIMEDWANFGVEGFFMGDNPWLAYHKKLTAPLSKIVGALPHEVVVMNHLTVNLHLLMISFYRPTATRFKIICEAKAFPSDQYAMQSQINMHGLQVADCLIQVYPRAGSETIDHADILAAIALHGQQTALVLFSGVNYFTGQVFNMQGIADAAHQVGAFAGFDLAHAAGNIPLALHEWGVDFACWCSYKYLNSGPGAIAGAFIHEKNIGNPHVKRLEGWWGNDEKNRFKMEEQFTASPTAEAWQMSTAPIMLLAAHHAALQIFDEAGFENIVAKSKQLSSYLFFCLQQINLPTPKFTILTPEAEGEHGSQVSLSVHDNAKAIFDKLLPEGIFADWREPNIIRVAPVPLYNSFEDVFIFAQKFKQLLNVQP